MSLLKQWIIISLVIFAVAYIAPGIMVANFTTAVVTAVILGLINAFLRPILIIFTLPINILTLGLFTFVINALLVMLTDKLIIGFSVASFGWALILSLILSIVNFSISHRGEKYDAEKFGS
ncbi:membrane protein of unknown function [bacterium BMS3Abin15]|nr:membrane protein of unknown function [bacterium BMS3Abin15]HDZ85338.1 phage holin family protein [Candidatus Moranbacteria bacterium]